MVTAFLLASLVSLPALPQASAPEQHAPEPFPTRWLGPGPLHKVVLREEPDELRLALEASGAVVRQADYGSFRLLIVDPLPIGGRAALASSGLEVRDEWNRMAFDGIVVDGTAPDAAASQVASELLLEPGDAAGLHLIQFEGPLRDVDSELLRKLRPSFLQSVPMHAYVVQVPPERTQELSALADNASVQFVGAYQPAFKLTRALRQRALELPGPPLDITVQIVNGDGARAIVEEISNASLRALDYRRVGPYVNLDLEVDPAQLLALARHPRVFAVEPRGTRTLNDEAQGQISAGNLAGGTPTGPGYLSWLAGHGFDSSQFSSFAVNVVDDATGLTGHPDVPNSRVAFTLNPSSQSGAQGGHGFLNAHIVAGFNNSTGGAAEDPSGFNYGLGIAPWARVGSTAIFGSGGSDPGSYEANAYDSGSRISTNSWSFIDGSQNPIPDYDSSSQQYDSLTRDVKPGTSGNQELLVLFAAGNDGPTGNTVSTPSTAKNILTVGASENVRTSGTDGCGIANSGANNADDIISFTSQGPVNSSGGDGRWKPEIAGPGTHVQAGVPQSNYVGGSVCNQYWPTGQTLYGWSSGTSHSTPALAGGAALVYQDFLNLGYGAPSPAMNKALLVATAEYLTGVNAGDTLPSNTQGMGRMQLERPFGGTPYMHVDQSVVLGTSGATHTLVGSVADPAEPLRVTLVWTDAPGSTTGAPWVNDLDLTVNVGGSTYLGNVFSGASSTTGGSADFRNNTESVFLPPGTSGPFTVTVSAANIAADGVPGNGDGTDQDFALVAWNATPDGSFAQFSGTPTAGFTPLTVDFSDLSLGNITSWSWDFGDGTSSTAQEPQHVYTQPGTYTVTLSVDGPDGPDTETKPAYVVVTDPPPPGVTDGSFENQTPGTTPATPWVIAFGSGHLISPSGTSTDAGMPSDGTQWCELAADSTNNATPPSNPGGATNPPVGGAGITQMFSYASGQTELQFEAVFLRNEDPNSTYNDWMSVDISDGSTTQNLFYRDTSSSTAGTSSKYGYATTPIATVTVDLSTLFPSSTPATQFTLTAVVGNGTDDFQPSKGYVDDFRLNGDPLPVADFIGTPSTGTAPLAVAFTDQSSANPTSWAWDLGDGAQTTVENPLHTYTFPGTYTVALSATNAAGSDLATKTDYITVNFPAATGTLYGNGVAGNSGIPAFEAFRAAAPGSPLYLRTSGVPPATAVFFLYSTSSQTPGADLSSGFLLNVGVPVLLISPFLADAAGDAVQHLALGPALTGFSLYCQAVTSDGSGANTFSSSRGLRVDLP